MKILYGLIILGVIITVAFGIWALIAARGSNPYGGLFQIMYGMYSLAATIAISVIALIVYFLR